MMSLGRNDVTKVIDNDDDNTAEDHHLISLFLCFIFLRILCEMFPLFSRVLSLDVDQQTMRLVTGR